MTDAVVDVRTTAPGRLGIALSGEIDLDNVDLVEEELFRAVTNATLAVVLELGGLDYLDSAGLRCLFTVAERLRLLQVDLVVVVPRGSPTRRAVQLFGLDAVATVQLPDGQLPDVQLPDGPAP